ncbi:hypothetical protein F5X71_11140 [Nocardia brasiliensis]|uniref:Peptidase n=1 Tax=Nocardia brasiliensis TaxID=37326 RepID=A0A6G9XPH9_NOCBR|nr:hypothetical protein [Nocardia brasiliensis]QIS02806.1 hypothetical protein F5X71_11140 [Nocardia brasiliensis]
MRGERGLRAWWSARRRFEFCLTVAMVVALTGFCGALMLLPNTALPKPEGTAQHEAVGQATATDPRLAEIRRDIEPFGAILAHQVPTGDGQQSLVVGHRTQRIEMDVLEQALGAATTAVTEVWGPGWPQSTVVVVASSPSEFAGLVHGGAIMSAEVAAASVADPYIPGTPPTGQRIVFSPDAGRRLDPEGLRTLLRHELTHIATRAETRDGAPLWMLEGFADYVAHRDQGHPFTDVAPGLTARVRLHALPGDLPADADFAGPKAAATYEQAWSICAFVADKYDQPRLAELYRRLAAARQTPATEDEILRSVLGVTRQEFIAGWQAWLPAQVP